MRFFTQSLSMDVQSIKLRLLRHLARCFQFVLPMTIAGCTASGPSARNYKISSDAELIISSDTTNRIVTAVQLSRSLPIARATVNDPVYGKIKHYEGFWLED